MKDEDIDPGYLDSRRMDLLAEYLKSGRRFENLPVDSLRGGWVAAFQKMIENPDNFEAMKLHNDLESEFSARKIEPPHEMIDTEAYVTAVDQLLARLEKEDPEKMTEADAEMKEDLAIFRRARERKN